MAMPLPTPRLAPVTIATQPESPFSDMGSLRFALSDRAGAATVRYHASLISPPKRAVSTSAVSRYSRTVAIRPSFTVKTIAYSLL